MVMQDAWFCEVEEVEWIEGIEGVEVVEGISYLISHFLYVLS
jgi:hypothetical protein